MDVFFCRTLFVELLILNDMIYLQSVRKAGRHLICIFICKSLAIFIWTL